MSTSVTPRSVPDPPVTPPPASDPYSDTVLPTVVFGKVACVTYQLPVYNVTTHVYEGSVYFLNVEYDLTGGYWRSAVDHVLRSGADRTPLVSAFGDPYLGTNVYIPAGAKPSDTFALQPAGAPSSIIPVDANSTAAAISVCPGNHSFPVKVSDITG